MTYYHVPSMKLLDEEAKDMLNDETSFNDWLEEKKARLAATEAVRVVLFYSASVIDCLAEARGCMRHLVGKETGGT